MLRQQKKSLVWQTYRVCLTRTLSFTVYLCSGKIGRKCQIIQYALVTPTSSAAQCSTCYTSTCCGLDRPNLVGHIRVKYKYQYQQWSILKSEQEERFPLPSPPSPFLLTYPFFPSSPLPLTLEVGPLNPASWSGWAL